MCGGGGQELGWGDVPCIVGHLVASLASTDEVPVALPSQL